MYRKSNLLALVVSLCAAVSATAAPPTVKTVPAVAGNPAVPHDALANSAVTLKGTSSVQGPEVQATWDFGDSSSHLVSGISNRYDVSATHVYSGPVGTIYTATLKILDTRTGESASASYRVAIREKSLQVQASIAMDEALWYLHKTMNRSRLGSSDAGDWQGRCGYACDEKGAASAANLLAFEASGFLASGDSTNPYTETVARALNSLLQQPASARTDDWADAIAGSKGAGSRSPLDLAAATRGIRNSSESATEGKAATRAVALGGDSQNAESLLATLRAERAVTSEAPDSVSLSIARTLVDRQDASGFWTGHNPESQASLETARSITMLATVFPRSVAAAPILNVSSQVQVTSTGFLYSRVTKTNNGTITVANTSGTAIPGPLNVVLTNLVATVTVANANGTFNGDPYLTANVTSLDPGQSVDLPVRFNDPANIRISYTPVTYSGVFPPAPVSLGCPTATGTTGTAYSSALSGSGGVQPYAYSISAGSLPSNLTLDPNTGAITGTPTGSGPFTFTATLTDETGLPSGTANTSCTITISPATSPLALACPTSAAQVGVAYSSALSATGGTPNYTYSISTGSLPSQLSLNPATGAITGTPDTQGLVSFTGQVVDSTSGTPQTQTANCSINVAAPSTVAITVQTSPSGQSFTVDGNTYSTAQSFNWVPGSSHSIGTTSPQGSGGTRFVFNNWSDGGAISHAVTGPNAATTYTASFDTQYQLTTSVSPAGGGAVTPASGSYFAANSVQTVSATPNSNFTFQNWTGPVADANSASTTVTMTGPISITANFVANVGITVQTSPSGLSFTVDGTTYSTTQTFNWIPGSSHSIGTTTPQGSGGTRYVFNNWSDAGAITHSVTAAGSATVYTASFDTQYQLTTAVSPSGGGTVTPASGGFFTAGSVQPVQATANTNFAFNGWTGPVASATSASTTVTMTGPVSITANFATLLTLACPTAATANIGSAYSSSLTASGGTAAYTYSLNGGSLPPGLTLAPSTGLISGNPTTKGTYNFTGKVVDATSPIQQSATASCSILVPNRPPTTSGQSVTTNEDTAKTITLSGTDADGDALTFVIVTAPSHGTLVAAGAVACSGTPSTCTQNFTYTPSSNYNGSDSFTFKVNDGSADSTSIPTVSITINPVNDPPTAVAKAYSAQANMKISIPSASGLLVGASDPDANDAGFTSVLTVGGVSATNPPGGTISFNASTGAFDFDPPPGATGNVTFTYTVCDNGNPLPSLCSTATTVTVNVAGPVIWFVNPAQGTNGTGTLSNPFNSLGSATTALGSNTNQRIFVYSGSTSSGAGVTLLANDWLVGQGVTGTSFDSVMGITPPTGTIARPSIAGTAPTIQGTVKMNGSNTEVLGLNIQPPSSSAGLTATLAGPFTGLLVSDVPVISTNGARAVDLQNVSGTFTIKSVSATSADIGINLSNLNPSTGSFTITGNSGVCTSVTTTCSGGSILGSTNIGINLANAKNVSFSLMRVRNSTHYGLRGSTVSVLNVDHSLFDGTSGSASTEGAFYVDNWLASGTIDTTDISGSAGNNVNIQNTQGTLNRLTVSNSSIHDTPQTGNDGMFFGTSFAPSGGSGVVMNVTVNNTTFARHHGDHFQTTAQGLSSMDIVFSNNTLTGGNASALGNDVVVSDEHSSHVTVDFNGNHLTQAILAAFTFFQPNTSTASASLIGKFRNNVIGTTGVAGSGSAQSDGLTINGTGQGTITMNVTGNNIRHYNNYGINTQTGDGSPHVNVTVTGNTVQEPDSFALQGIRVQGGAATGDAPAICADIGGAGALANSANNSGGAGLADYRLRQQFSSTIQLPGLSGDPATFVASRNGDVASKVAISGTITAYVSSACPQAP